MAQGEAHTQPAPTQGVETCLSGQTRDVGDVTPLGLVVLAPGDRAPGRQHRARVVAPVLLAVGLDQRRAPAQIDGKPGGIDDLANEHRNVLQVEHFARLAPILDMVETAAGQNESLPFAEDDGQVLAAKVVAVNRVLLEHRDSRVKAVQALVEEIDAILDGGEESDASVLQS